MVSVQETKDLVSPMCWSNRNYS